MRLFNAQLQAHFYALLLDPSHALFQVFPAFMHQVPIVHIASVALDVQLFLDEVVKLICCRQRQYLRNLTAKPNALVTEHIDKVLNQLQRLFVLIGFVERFHQQLMRDTIEVARKVEQENIALVAVLANLPLKMAIKSLHRKAVSLSLHGCSVIINK